jgi:8-hydroxy-5-deazaflavin:NADPH oxidoreductase
MSRVGIIGSGPVGRALGLGFCSRGYQVMIGSREPGQEELQRWIGQTQGGGATGTFSEAASFAEEVAVFAIRWSGAPTAAALTGAANLAGKIVIDTTNPVASFGDSAGLAIGCSDSAAEQVQRWFPTARVVKCFNTPSPSYMVDPDWPEGRGEMFICGNDPAARAAVGAIAEDFGWHCIDIGELHGSRLIEPMAILRMEAGRVTGVPDVAFRLAKVTAA